MKSSRSLPRVSWRLCWLLGCEYLEWIPTAGWKWSWSYKLKVPGTLVRKGAVQFCLSLGCYNKLPQTRWLTQQIFIFHSSGGQKIQDQSTSGTVSCEGVLLGLRTAISSLHPHVAEERERKQDSQVYLYKVSKPIIRPPPWKLHYLPKPLPPNSIIL